MNQIHKRYLTQTGWIESKNSNQSIRQGKYIPWTSYAFTHWIEKRSLESLSILEFGSGASTIFWATKFANVYAIESDADWLTWIKDTSAPFHNVHVFNLLSNNLELEFDESYQTLKDTFIQDLRLFPELDFDFNLIDFNLIHDYIAKSQYFFVDGGPRNLYMQILAQSVDENALIFVDNSDQDYTLIGRAALLRRGFKEIEFNSLGPLNHSATSTSVFLKNLKSF